MTICNSLGYYIPYLTYEKIDVLEYSDYFVKLGNDTTFFTVSSNGRDFEIKLGKYLTLTSLKDLPKLYPVLYEIMSQGYTDPDSTVKELGHSTYAQKALASVLRGVSFCKLYNNFPYGLKFSIEGVPIEVLYTDNGLQYSVAQKGRINDIENQKPFLSYSYSYTPPFLVLATHIVYDFISHILIGAVLEEKKILTLK